MTPVRSHWLKKLNFVLPHCPVIIEADVTTQEELAKPFSVLNKKFGPTSSPPRVPKPNSLSKATHLYGRGTGAELGPGSMGLTSASVFPAPWRTLSQGNTGNVVFNK